MSIDEALDIYQVEQNESDTFPKVWWLVTNGYGTIASFSTESAACSYRLYMVNRLLNN